VSEKASNRDRAGEEADQGREFADEGPMSTIAQL